MVCSGQASFALHHQAMKQFRGFLVFYDLLPFFDDAMTGMPDGRIAFRRKPAIFCGRNTPINKLRQIGPGAMVAAAFIGPGTVTTATIAGSSYGYTLLWAILFSVLATYILQEMSARLGVVAGMGVGQAIRIKMKTPALKVLAAILVVGAVFIGNAAYEAGNISGAALGFDQFTVKWPNFSLNLLIPVIGLLAFVLLFIGKYRWIERSLVVMVSAMGLIFIIAAFAVMPDFFAILKGMFTPKAPDGSLLMVVGLIGTTVVPYNLFLHASSARKKWQGAGDLPASRFDTLVAVVLGGLITMAVLIAAAAAFEGSAKPAESAADLATGLQPLLGDWSTMFLAFGFLAAGLSSAITAPLAAAFATSEILGWEDDLRGKRFRMVWMLVLLVGIGFSCAGFKPTAVILFAQVANGLLLPVIALFLVWLMNDKSIMGQHANKPLVNVLGILIILVTIGLGLKGILSATGVI